MPFFGIDYIDVYSLQFENGPFGKIDRDLACLKLTLTTVRCGHSRESAALVDNMATILQCYFVSILLYKNVLGMLAINKLYRYLHVL